MKRLLSYLLIGILPLLSGCAAIPIELVAEGADAGMSFASGNARSFTYPRAEVHAASLQTLNLMDITVTKDQEKGKNISEIGKTDHLKVALTLTTITPHLTKVSVTAKKNWFSRDKTVEAEMLFQINRALRASSNEKGTKQQRKIS